MAIRTSSSSPASPTPLSPRTGHPPTPRPPISPRSTRGGGTDTLRPGPRTEQATGSELEKQLYGKPLRQVKPADMPPKPPAGHRNPRPQRPPKNNGRDREHHASHVRRQLGIPDHATSDATPRSGTLSQLRDWIGGLLTAWNASPFTPVARAFILDCPMDQRPEDPAIAPAFSVDRYVKALGHLYAPEHIHRVPIDSCRWVYAQNLVKAGPGGVMFFAQPYRTGRAGIEQGEVIDTLRRYFETIGQPYRVLDFPVNWANVDHEHLPDGKRLLVLTDVVNSFTLSSEAKAALIEAYGSPEHVLMPVSHAAADRATPPTHTYRDDRCYDDDLSRKFLKSATGKLWALFRERCYSGVVYCHTATQTVLSFKTMRAALQYLSIGQIPITDDDAQRIPANSVSRDGRVVLPQRVSPALMTRLDEAGLQVFVPEPGEELGNVDPRQASLFAIHCVVAQSEEPLRGLAPGSDQGDSEPAQRSEL